jgi:hypothetical protein
MLVKDVRDEDFVNYKKAAMFIACPTCTFKCDKENWCQLCQNMALVKTPTININNEELAQRYLNNPITHAIVFGGLEPFDTFDDVFDFIKCVRETHHCDDDIVIYTGYNHNEISEQIHLLRNYINIIIKYGRFRPNEKAHFDSILGINLISNNQYAEKIS